jgi:hypothetical protein
VSHWRDLNQLNAVWCRSPSRHHPKKRRQVSAPRLAASIAVFSLSKSETFGFFLHLCMQTLSKAKSERSCLAIQPSSPAPEFRTSYSSSVRPASTCALLSLLIAI